ncbi:RbsD/FucU domain-containing protein [Lachnospiraceae bacterium 62-35]
MLKGISKLLTGDLLKGLCDMGHGDKFAIVDANYPAQTMGQKLITYPGIRATDLLEAIVKIFPLDHIVPYPAILMEMTDKDKENISDPIIWTQFSDIIHTEYGNEMQVGKVSREEFYELSKKSYLIIQSGEERLYGNILLVKGVVN